MFRRNSQGYLHSLPALATGWSRLLLGLTLLLVAASCTSTPGNIGVGLPNADANTGAYLVDTLTIRASTVLRDSVITSTSSNLFVGRYTDPQFGTITAKSYVTIGLSSSFTPDQTQVFDSLVLVLKPTTYRYGDTTKTQTLLNVYPLTSFIPTTQAGYASPKLSPMSARVGTTLLNQNKVVPLRARPNSTSLRLRLADTVGIRLLRYGKNGLILTQEQLDSRFPGLALLPGAADDAALVQFNAAADAAALVLYYHDPSDATTALNHSFGLSTGRHFYQTEANRSTTLLAPLTISLSQLNASRTAQQTYIQGAFGLQTKLEIPYLYNLRSFGQHIIITNATMTALVPTSTTGFNLAPPASLTVTSTDQNNHQGTVAFATGVQYNAAVANLAGVNQAGYTWSVLSYCQSVLSNTIPNDGMLINTTTPAVPERVVLGGPNRATEKLQLRIYLISND